MAYRKRITYAPGEREAYSPSEEADRYYARFGSKDFEIWCHFLPSGDPTEGGYIVYGNDEGEPQIFAWEPNQPDDEYPRSYETWFVSMAAPGEVLSDLDWVDWKQVGEDVDMSREEIGNLNRTEAPCSRAELYEAVANYWGWGELDHYPIVRAASEMADILGGEDGLSERGDWLEEDEDEE